MALPDDQKYKIIESDAFDIRWGAVLKQKNGDKEEVIQFASGVWNEAQIPHYQKGSLGCSQSHSPIPGAYYKYSLYFNLRADCPSLKGVLEKDAKDLAAKQIFSRWQAMFSLFSSIEHNKGESNSLPDFITREYLLFTRGNRTHQHDEDGPKQSGSLPLGIEYYDRYLDQTTSRASHGQQGSRPDVYEGEWSKMDWTRAENILRMTGAAYVKHHFDGRGNISHSVCILKEVKKWRDWTEDRSTRIAHMTGGRPFGRSRVSYVE